MMEVKNCTTCKHYSAVKDPNNILAVQGQCFYGPPTPQMMQTAQGTGIANLRPVVTDKDHCGQHIAAVVINDSH